MNDDYAFVFFSFHLVYKLVSVGLCGCVLETGEFLPSKLIYSILKKEQKNMWSLILVVLLLRPFYFKPSFIRNIFLAASLSLSLHPSSIPNSKLWKSITCKTCGALHHLNSWLIIHFKVYYRVAVKLIGNIKVTLQFNGLKFTQFCSQSSSIMTWNRNKIKTIECVWLGLPAPR